MKLFSADRFLDVGSAALPNGPWRAVAIHPSSEVDLVLVGGVLLSPGSLVPASAGETVHAVRASSTTTNLPTGGPTPMDPIGERLVLQLYEACDVLVAPPGLRAPAIYRGILDDTELPDAVSDPEPVLFVPFQGRTRAALSFARTDLTVDLEVFITGIRLGKRGESVAFPTEAPAETWWNGGGAAPADTFGNVEARTVLVEDERYDLLVVSCRGAAGGGASYLLCEVFDL